MSRSESQRDGLAAAAACLIGALLWGTTPAPAQEADFVPVDSSQQIGAGLGAPSARPQDAATAAGRSTLPEVRSALGRGDWESARGQMLGLASWIGQSYDLKGLEALEEEILSSTETPALLGMGLLLFDVSREALESRQFLASTVIRRAGFGCLDKLENTRGVPTALVADAYTLIGSALQSSGSSSSSGESFRRAVKLDPELGPAQLGLGIYLDRLGHTEEAIEVFGSMPPVQPYHGEASLRKAVAQIQLGHERNAQRTLETLLDPRAPSQPEPWVQSVAAQELAMLRLRREGPHAAREVLQDAVKRLPHDRRLYVLLAFVHNSAGQRAAASAVLRDMERQMEPRQMEPESEAQAPPDEAASPRHRLAEWHVEVPAGLELRVRQQAESAIATGRIAP